MQESSTSFSRSFDLLELRFWHSSAQFLYFRAGCLEPVCMLEDEAQLLELIQSTCFVKSCQVELDRLQFADLDLSWLWLCVIWLSEESVHCGLPGLKVLLSSRSGPPLLSIRLSGVTDSRRVLRCTRSISVLSIHPAVLPLPDYWATMKSSADGDAPGKPAVELVRFRCAIN